LGYYVAHGKIIYKIGLLEVDETLKLLKTSLNLVIENWYGKDLLKLTEAQAKEDFYNLFIQRPIQRMETFLSLLNKDKEYESIHNDLQNLKIININGKDYKNPYCR